MGGKEIRKKGPDGAKEAVGSSLRGSRKLGVAQGALSDRGFVYVPSNTFGVA